MYFIKYFYLLNNPPPNLPLEHTIVYPFDYPQNLILIIAFSGKKFYSYSSPKDKYNSPNTLSLDSVPGGKISTDSIYT